MKKILIILACILLCLPFYAQEERSNYYYYFGEKIFLTERTDKMFIKLVKNADKQEVAAFIQEQESVNLNRFNGAAMDNIVLLEAREGKTFSLETLSKFRENPNVLSAHFLLEYENNIMAVLSHHFTVKLKPTTLLEQLQNLVLEYNCKIDNEYEFVPRQYIISIARTCELNAMQMANLFYETELFEFSEPNFGIFNSLCSNDYYFDQQWGLKNTGQMGGTPEVDIKAEQAWEMAQGAFVVVAVVDLGVDKLHPDLIGHVGVGYDATGNYSGGYPVSELDGHGTQCAGVVGATKNNGIGIAGVAPQCLIMPVKYATMKDDFGFIYLDTDSIMESNSIIWAYQNGASVISCSWKSIPSSKLTNAIHDAVTLGRGGKGCVVVAGTGNEALKWIAYPARLPDVIAVGAIERHGMRANFSNYGDELDVVAPGVGIWTTNWPHDDKSSGSIYDFSSFIEERREIEDTVPPGYICERDTPPGPPKPSYILEEGTSMACPHVAGIAALILSVNNNLTGQEVRNIIEITAQKVRDTIPYYIYETKPNRPNGTWHEEMGYGLVDAHAAVCLAQCYNPSIPMVKGAILQNTTWSTPRLAIGNIEIPNGVTLTVTSEVNCFDDVSIIVQPGGKLAVNGGTLSTCLSKPWQGVTVMGSTGQQPKGSVTITNGGTIENAVCGVTVHYGASLTASNAQFVNNTVSVYLAPKVAGQTGSQSIFTKTNFILNNAYLGNLLDFEAHIKMESSASAEVRGCQFSSVAPTYDLNRNNGIWVLNSALTVTEYCPSYLYTYPDEKCSFGGMPSVFTGLTHGIFARNTGVSPAFIVRYSNFNDNKYGVKIDAISYHKVIGNNFIFENSSNALGLYVQNSTGYKIEENNFENRYPATNNTGLTIKNSGEAENEVYKNIFDGLYIGQNFLRRNSDQIEVWRNGTIPLSFNTGLQTLCNTFTKTQTFGATPYIHILMGTNTTPRDCDNDHIRKNQGSSALATGNKFAVLPTDTIICNNKHAIDYYYCNAHKGESPAPSSPNVYAHAITSGNPCPSKIGSVIINPQDKSGMENIEKLLVQYNEWNDEYKNYIDILDNTDSYDEETLNYLSGMVSHYSALKDNYFNSIVAAVMGDEMIRGLDDEMMYENLRYLFNYRNNYTDNLSIAETYLAENNYNEAMAAISKMHAQFELDEEQTLEVVDLQTYIQWLQSLENTRTTIYTLSEREIMYLVDYAYTSIGRGVVFAKNLLCAIYNICIDELPIEKSNNGGEKEKGRTGEKEDERMRGLDEKIENQSKSAQSVSSEFQNNALDNITLTPNPTTGELQITNYELQITNIEVYDVYGRTTCRIKRVANLHALAATIGRCRKQHL
jgi:hypothetical protein